MQTTSTPTEKPKSDPYKIPFGGTILDPYKVADLFQITDPVIFQALKKILRFGRKHKSLASDVREAITSLERWEAMQREKVPADLGSYGSKPPPKALANLPCPYCIPGIDNCNC